MKLLKIIKGNLISFKIFLQEKCNSLSLSMFYSEFLLGLVGWLEKERRRKRELLNFVSFLLYFFFLLVVVYLFKT